MIIQDYALSTQKLEKIKRTQQSLQTLQEQRQNAWRIFLAPSILVEGSFRELLIRCGKPNCHCQDQPAHPIARLSHWEKGKLKNQVVRVADKEQIKTLSDNYKDHKQALSQLLKMSKKECQLLKNVIKLESVSYE